MTWDLVTDPSNGPSWVNGIFEGKTWENGNDFSGEEEDVVVEVETLTEKQAKEEFYRHIMESIKEIEKSL